MNLFSFVGRATALFALAAGCGGPSVRPEQNALEHLRANAADRPQNPDAQLEWAAAEFTWPGGDPAQLERALARLDQLDPQNPRGSIMRGISAELHGNPDAALDAYLEAANEGLRSRDPLGRLIAEVAIASASDLRDQVRGYSSKVERAYAALWPLTEGNPAVRAALALERIEFAARKGDVAEARGFAREAGCIEEWKVIGPIGPRELLGFDSEYADIPKRGELPEEYDLGPSRGIQPTRLAKARGCAVHLGTGPVGGAGTTFARATIDTPREGTYQIQIDTPNSVEVYLDGERMLRRDTRRESLPRLTFFRANLSAGRHEILVRVTTRHPNPVLVVALHPSSQRNTPTDLGATSMFEAYMLAASRVARADFVGAREVLDAAPSDEAGAPVLVLRSAIALSDPHLSSEMRRDESRGYLRNAAQLDPRMWVPVANLARLEAAEGRTREAIAALREAARQWPRVVSIPLALAELYSGNGWRARYDEALEAARSLVPDGCSILRAELEAARARERTRAAVELTEALVQCDARSEARFRLFLSQAKWDEAAQELRRLESLDTSGNRFGYLNSELALATARGDEEAASQALTALRALSIRSESYPLEIADRALAQGQPDEARRTLTGFLVDVPENTESLYSALTLSGAEDPLARYRIDGPTVIREFERSGRSYGEPQVLLLDYTVVRVFTNGATLELTHNIWKVQSEEAVDEQGEFSPPPGARILRLRTIKADGRFMEPDDIQGKDTISLPNLMPGDYVEYEYIRSAPPPAAFPNGYLGDRFYFKGFEVPYDRTQLTVILPQGLDPWVDPRGPAPTLEERRDGNLRVLTWMFRESRPLRPEPGSVAMREFVPSINLGVRATWESFVESLVDLLIDKDVKDPGAVRLVQRIAPPSLTPDERARRIYKWVLDNITDGNDPFGSAPVMVSSRTGHRGRVLHYLYGLAGIDSQLALVRSIQGDATVSELADANTYESLMVRARAGNDWTWLTTTQRHLPFGYVPPSLRGQDAIVLTLPSPRVTHETTPNAWPRGDGRTLQATVDLEENGGAQIRVVETVRGFGAASWRTDLENIAAAELESRFEQGYVARLVPGASLDALQIDARSDDEAPLVIRYAFSVESLGRRAGDMRVLPGLLPSMLVANFAPLAERTTTEVIAAPFDLDIEMKIQAPSGHRFEHVPESTTLEGPQGARFVSTARLEDGALHLVRSVRVPVMRITPTDYPNFVAFARQVDAAESAETGVR